MISNIVKESFVCAELGVLLGEFSSEILSLNPRKLFLVDTWVGGSVISGNHDGNDIKEYSDGNLLYELVRSKFQSHLNVTIQRCRSTDFLLNYSGDNFDFVYIDTTHDYMNTFKELELALMKTKKGGYLCGHDFAVNEAKCDNYDFCNSFEVRDAVNDFCKKNNQTIDSIALDGCLSFGIKTHE